MPEAVSQLEARYVPAEGEKEVVHVDAVSRLQIAKFDSTALAGTSCTISFRREILADG